MGWNAVWMRLPAFFWANFEEMDRKTTKGIFRVVTF